jgi:glycosyltransferase involved in cell wall biosynthesis
VSFSISVIVPVYNEIELVAASTRAIEAFVRAHFADYEILLIESGSTDGSGAVCDALAKELPRVNVFHEGARNGFGSALKWGYKNATKDLVWLVTVDLPFPLTAILEALPLLEKYDCVFSYRSVDDRGVLRKTMSFFYNALMRALLGLKVKHINSAFRVFKRSLIQSVPARSNGWFIDAEVLYWISRKNATHIEIPVPVVNRTAGRSSVSMMSPFAMVWEAFKFMAGRKPC